MLPREHRDTWARTVEQAHGWVPRQRVAQGRVWRRGVRKRVQGVLRCDTRDALECRIRSIERACEETRRKTLLVWTCIAVVGILVSVSFNAIRLVGVWQESPSTPAPRSVAVPDMHEEEPLLPTEGMWLTPSSLDLPLSMAHIHEYPAGYRGQVVYDESQRSSRLLFDPTDRGCVSWDLDPALRVPVGSTVIVFYDMVAATSGTVALSFTQNGGLPWLCEESVAHTIGGGGVLRCPLGMPGSVSDKTLRTLEMCRNTSDTAVGDLAVLRVRVRSGE